MLILGLIPIVAFIVIYLRIFSTLNISRRETLLRASIIWGLLVTLATEILSLFHQLNQSLVLIFWILILLAVMFIPPLKKFPTKFWSVPVLTKLEWVMTAVMGFIVILVALTAWNAPPNSWDALNYHMSRVMFWKQNMSVDHYPTPEFRQLFFPPWAGYVFLHFQILTGSDRLANLVSWFSWVGCILGASFISSLLGARRETQFLSALLTATIPTAIIEASGVRIDTLCAYWLVCFASLLLLLEKRGAFIYIILMGCVLGLGILTKGTMPLLALPFIAGLITVVFKKFSLRRRLGGLILFFLIAGALNSGFFYRNYQLTADPLGPAPMRRWGLTHDMNGKLVFSNVLRVTAFQLGTSLKGWDDFIGQSVYGLHDFFHIDALDERSTIAHTRFNVGVSTHEDAVANFVQTLLILISFVMLGIHAIRVKRKDILFYILAVSVSYVIICSSIKWTNHITRYCLPLLVLSMAAVALGAELFARQRIVIGFLILSLTVTAMPYVFQNNLRRIYSAKKETIFNASRLQQYFRNDRSLLVPYQEALDSVLSRSCDRVGLYMGFNYWDYPFWVMAGEKSHHPIRFEHVKISHFTPSVYPLGDFKPCALIAVDYNANEIILGGNVFRKTSDYGKTSVYTPDHVTPVTPERIFVLGSAKAP